MLHARAAYDLVLMDVQMPVMDGYTATSRIRQDSALKDLPVLAMTANVMAEDRARVAQVGMNDHISKPIVPQELFGKLMRWIPHAERPLPEGFGSPAGKATQDEVVLPASLPGVADFAKDHGQDMERIRHSLAAEDLLVAQRVAHTLKGVGGAIGAVGLQQRAGALESALRAGRLQEVEPLVDGLGSALQPLLDGLQAWSSAQAAGGNAAPVATSKGLTAVAAGAGGDDKTATASADVDADALMLLMNELQHLLQEMDPEAGDRAEALAAHLPLSTLAQELTQQAQSFEFDTALQTLQSLKGSLQ